MRDFYNNYSFLLVSCHSCGLIVIMFWADRLPANTNDYVELRFGTAYALFNG